MNSNLLRPTFFSISILAIIISSVYAQPAIRWQKNYGGSNFDQAEAIRRTFDGGYIVTGTSTSSDGDITVTHGSGDVWIVRLDSIGSILWQHNYGGSNDDAAFSIEQTSDSGFIIAGSSASSNGDLSGNYGFNDCWIFKIDGAGNLQWQKSFGGSGFDIAYDIHPANDHGFIFAGYTNSTDHDVSVNHGFDDCWVVKLDSGGAIQWEKTFGGSDQDQLFSIRQNSDGNYSAAGFSKSVNGDVTNPKGGADFWILKIDSLGALIWQHSFGGSSDDRAHSLAKTSDGGCVVAGTTASSDSDVTANHGGEDIWLIKLDSTGSMEWGKTYGGSGADNAYCVRLLPNENVAVCGLSYSADGDVTGNHGGYDYWVFQTDGAGTLLWNKSLGGSSVEEAHFIECDDAGRVTVAGGTLSFDGDVTSTHGDFDYWIVALDSFLIATDVSGLSLEKNEIMIIPNPATSSAVLRFNLSHPEFVRVTVYDALSQMSAELFSGTAVSGINEINLPIEKMKKGIYFCEVRSEADVMHLRFVIQ